jgi:hypothetical protein
MINNVSNLAANLWKTNSNTPNRTPSQTFELPNISRPGPDALVSGAFRIPNGGWMNATVFKAESFREENPTMLVRGTDVCGTAFEKEINVRNINPKTASFAELLAFDGFASTNGKQSQTARIAARALMIQELNGKEFPEFNAFTQTDFAAALRGLTEGLCANRNYETLMWVNTNTDYFFTHFNLER